MADKFTMLDRRQYITKAGDGLVDEGDEDAASLFGIPGRRVLTADCKRLGYKPMKKAKGNGKKEAPALENKAAKTPETKKPNVFVKTANAMKGKK